MRAFSNFQLFAICVLIWGSTWLAITYQLGHVAPEMSIAYRFVLASLCVLAYCRWRGISLRFTLKQHGEFALFGAAMFSVSYIFVYYAESNIASGMVAIAYSASPMVNMLMARAMFGTPMTLRVSLGASFGILGITAVFWHEFALLSASRNASLGASLALLSVLISSMGSMAASRIHTRGYPIWSSMGWGMFYGGVLAFFIGLALGRSITFVPTFAYVGTLLYLTILGSVVTFACYLTLQARIGVARAAYVGVMTPVVALAVSFFFENFTWGWLTTFGVLLLIVGNVVILGKPTAQAAP